MNAFDAENEMFRRKAEAQAMGDAYMQLADFNRPRRRNFLGALLAALRGLGREAEAGPAPVTGKPCKSPARKASQA